MRCEPVFAAVATKVVWVGDVGAGSRLKLVINAWLAAILAGLAEAIALAEGLGVDPRQLLAAIEGRTPRLRVRRGQGSDDDRPQVPGCLSAAPAQLTKDVNLVADAASRAGLELRLPGAIRSLLEQAEDAHGEDDMSAIIEALLSR